VLYNRLIENDLIEMAPLTQKLCVALWWIGDLFFIYQYLNYIRVHFVCTQMSAFQEVLAYIGGFQRTSRMRLTGD